MTPCANPLAYPETACDGPGQCLNEAFCRHMAHAHADAILRDVGKLDRAWSAYQRTHSVPLPGQLDLFAPAAQ